MSTLHNRDGPPQRLDTGVLVSYVEIASLGTSTEKEGTISNG